MSLLDFLRPQGAQAPGAMSQPNPLKSLLAPEVALPMAAMLMGNQGNMANLGNAFAIGGQGIAQQKELQAQTAKDNKTYEFFKTQAPEYAQMIDAGMPVSMAWQEYNQARTAKKGQGFINAGGGNLFNSDTGEWVSAPGGGAEGVAGLNPVWMRDENGNPVIGQVTKDGKVLRSQIPDGLSPMGPYERSFETGAGKAAGEVTGAAAGALPAAVVTSQRVAQQVEELKNDPYLPSMLGPVDSRLPNVTQDAARVQSKINQLQGGAFMEARQLLKGGGAITDYEGVKAEQAFARLNQAQSVEDFQAALDEFNMYVQQGLQKLQAQAGMGGGRAPGYGSAAPKNSGVDYKSKYGLD
jgi:hypothetical protein